MKLSIVASMYYSAPYIQEFCARCSRVARELVGEDYEIVLVNDGSPDTSLEIAMTLAKEDPHITVVDLSRNFGQHRAMLTGIEYARGEYIFAIDIDLEEDPELLRIFWDEMHKSGVDHVYGVQKSRKGGWFERVSGQAYYRFFNWLSSVKIPPNALMAKLMSRRFADTLLQYRERNIFLAGLIALCGYEQKGVECVKKSKGSTTYTLYRKLQQTINSITSFSTKPLYFIFVFGIIVSVLCALFAVYLLGRKLIWGDILAGWTSLMLLLCSVFGVLTALIGIIGVYIAKIFDEVKNRPYVTIRQVWRDGHMAAALGRDGDACKEAFSLD